MPSPGPHTCADRDTAYLLIDEIFVLRTIGRRLLFLIPTLFGLSILLFAWVRALPGGPAVALLGEKATPEAVARVNELYGFDEPSSSRLHLDRATAQGDFGTSIQTNRPVVEEFMRRFPATLELSVMALIFAIGVGIPLGYWAARRHGKLTDHASVVLSLIGIHHPGVLPGVHPEVRLRRAARMAAVGRPSGSANRRHPSHRVLRVGRHHHGASSNASWDAILHLSCRRSRWARSRSPSSSASPGPASWRCRTRLRAHRTGEGRRSPRRCANRYILRNAMLPGDHDDRPADRTPDLGRRAHRDGVRVPGHRFVPSRGRSSPGTSRSSRDSSSSSRSRTR